MTTHNRYQQAQDLLIATAIVTVASAVALSVGGEDGNMLGLLIGLLSGPFWTDGLLGKY